MRRCVTRVTAAFRRIDYVWVMAMNRGNGTMPIRKRTIAMLALAAYMGVASYADGGVVEPAEASSAQCTGYVSSCN